MDGAVFFDCDGVLINSEQIASAVLSFELAKYDFGYTRAQFLELVSGYEQHRGIEMVCKDFKEQKGYDLPADFEEKLWEKVKKHCLSKHMKALPGVEALFQSLERHNVPFAVCTNGERETVEANLVHAGLLKYVQGRIITKEDVESPKPAPDVYHAGMALFGVSPKDCIGVEDSQTGTKAVRKAGMFAIGYIGENHRDDLREKELLLAAGSHKIAYNMDTVRDVISERFGIDLKASAPKADGHRAASASLVSSNAPRP